MTLTPEMVAIAPCPFCGGPAELTTRPIDLPGWDDGVGWTASCKGEIDADCCGSYFFDFKRKEWAIEQWNARAQSQRAVGVEELRKLQAYRVSHNDQDLYESDDPEADVKNCYDVVIRWTDLRALIERAGGGA